MIMITERIRHLRQQSVAAPATLTAERALLITRLLKSGRLEGDPTPVRRAKIFHYLMENKQIFIAPGQLIVGERGPAPKATPTYP